MGGSNPSPIQAGSITLASVLNPGGCAVAIKSRNGAFTSAPAYHSQTRIEKAWRGVFPFTGWLNGCLAGRLVGWLAQHIGTLVTLLSPYLR